MTYHLNFEGTAFNVLDHHGKVWLRAADIAEALGYSHSDKISRIYRRHAREFTPDMTAVVEAPDLEPRSGVAGPNKAQRTKKALENQRSRAFLLPSVESVVCMNLRLHVERKPCSRIRRRTRRIPMPTPMPRPCVRTHLHDLQLDARVKDSSFRFRHVRCPGAW